MEIVTCKTCGLLQQAEALKPGQRAECARCGDVLHRESPDSRTYTLAFTLAALFLYVPANIYPIMIMEYMGQHSENTVWGGIRVLYQERMWYVAIIVFMASILVPLLKLIGLFFLVAMRSARWQRERTWIYRVICQLGPWAMLDVFLLAILVALLRFGRFATVEAGPGVYAFASVVVLTLLASASFNPRLIWEPEKTK